MSKEVPLQQDMFTSEWVDNRTTSQRRADAEWSIPMQREMFPVHETVQMGVRVRPWLAELPSAPLVLVSQDVRTEEEVERDLMREAEALTSPMFAVEMQQEKAEKHDGETTEDETNSLPEENPTVHSSSSAVRGAAPREGLRARLRRERVNVRTRQPEPQPAGVVPTLWMERDYIQKRLPYLADGILRLDEDEITHLAENISEVMQQTYWTILGIVLAHYTNHEQGETATA